METQTEKVKAKKVKDPNLVLMHFMVRKEFAEMMDQIIEIKKGGTRAEVFRNAVFDYYNKIDKPYLRLTPRMREKEKELTTEQKRERMSAEDYVRNVVKGVVLSNAEGEEFCIFHFYANTLKAIPLGEAKSYFEKYPEEIAFNAEQLLKWSIESQCRYNKDVLSAVGIEWPDGEN